MLCADPVGMRGRQQMPLELDLRGPHIFLWICGRRPSSGRFCRQLSVGSLEGRPSSSSSSRRHRAGHRLRAGGRRHRSRAGHPRVATMAIRRRTEAGATKHAVAFNSRFSRLQSFQSVDRKVAVPSLSRARLPARGASAGFSGRHAWRQRFQWQRKDVDLHHTARREFERTSERPPRVGVQRDGLKVSGRKV